MRCARLVSLVTIVLAGCAGPPPLQLSSDSEPAPEADPSKTPEAASEAPVSDGGSVAAPFIPIDVAADGMSIHVSAQGCPADDVTPEVEELGDQVIITVEGMPPPPEGWLACPAVSWGVDLTRPLEDRIIVDAVAGMRYRCVTGGNEGMGSCVTVASGDPLPTPPVDTPFQERVRPKLEDLQAALGPRLQDYQLDPSVLYLVADEKRSVVKPILVDVFGDDAEAVILHASDDG